MKTVTLIASTFLLFNALQAESPKIHNADANQTVEWTFLPYAIPSSRLGLTGGIAAMGQNVFEPGTRVIGTLFYGLEQDITTNGKPDTQNFRGGALALTNFRVPYTDRLFLTAWGISSFKPKTYIYLDGSHKSKEENKLVTSGQNDYFTLTFSYVFPWGEGVDNPEGVYDVKDGFAIGREKFGNGMPFETGRTEVGMKAFYEHQGIENWNTTLPWQSFTEKPEWNDSGLRFYLLHDNTDYRVNPSRGYSFQLQYSRDFGWGESLQSWDNIEFRFSKYFEMDTFNFTQQNVIALNFWTAYSPGWEKENEILPGIDAHRPPSWEGPSLGGYYRMRGYESYRFSDKAAVYATAEYRMTLDWNPFKKYGLLKEWTPVTIDWLQLVGFVEAGRVNEAYDSDLLCDLKYDAGLSLRFFSQEMPIRLDVAYGDEGTNLWFMVNHPFDF